MRRAAARGAWTQLPVDRGDQPTALQLAGGDFILCCASMATERRPSPARPHETSRRSPLEGLPIGTMGTRGAALGTFAGIKVVRYNHGHPSNKIDRLFLGSMVEAGSHGDVKAGFSFPY